MSKHTPGKWTVTGTDYQGCYLIKQHERPINYTETEANALLIAAAPDLLEALKLIVDGYAHDRTVLQRDIMTAKAALVRAGVTP